MRKTLAGAAMVVTIAACAPGAVVETAAGPMMTPAPAPATADHLPAGTMMQVQLTQPLGTAHSQVGDRFSATVETPIVARNGQTVIPAGAVIQGEVTGITTARAGQPAAIRLHFDRLQAHGQTHAFSANVVEADVQVADGDPIPRALERAAVGAAAGAVLGMIVMGDLAATLTGAALGAGLGTIISLGTETADANLPVGTRMTIQSAQHVQLH
jgi:hypothetical protein